MAGADHIPPELPRTVADIAIANLEAMVAGADLGSAPVDSGIVRAAGTYAMFQRMAERDWAVYSALQGRPDGR